MTDPAVRRTPRILAVAALIAGALAAIRWASRHIREDLPPSDVRRETPSSNSPRDRRPS